MSFEEYATELLWKVKEIDDMDIDLPNEFVITLDGGGVRCILQLKILERLLDVFPDLLTRCTLLAGTSAGSFMASGLACGGIELCQRLFQKESVQAIFSRTWTECFVNGWGTWRPKYDPSELERVLKDAFGTTRLCDVPKRLIITSFDLEGQPNSEDPKHHNFGVQHWSPKLYDNYGPNGELLYELTLRSSAAPCYFPSHDQYVDGGVVANNPSAHAISRLVQLQVPLDKITLLSLGSGNNPFHIQGDQAHNWGFVQWSSVFLNLIMDAPSEGAVIMSKQLLGDRYHRCNPILPTQIDLDDATALAQLERIGLECDLLPTIDFLYHHWFPDLPPMMPANVEVEL